MDEFINENLAELAAEILAWQNTGVLTGGKLRSLAIICAIHYKTEDNTLQIAESLVNKAALREVAKQTVNE